MYPLSSYLHLLSFHSAAVKRCYESIRRNYMERQDGKEEYVHQQSKRRKYRSRRQRVRELIMVFSHASYALTS